MSNVIYYGMSGTFKATTIKAAIKENPEIIPIWSMIKPWKYYETKVFPGMVDRNNINFAILHFCLLKHSIRPGRKFCIERGVTDMAFYNGLRSDDNWVKKAVTEEEILTGPSEKILLLQKDEDFIENVVLKEQTRKEVFPGGLKDFLEQQERYVEFTKKYNKISKVIEIKNAKEYLESTLGLIYKPEN